MSITFCEVVGEYKDIGSPDTAYSISCLKSNRLPEACLVLRRLSDDFQGPESTGTRADNTYALDVALTRCLYSFVCTNPENETGASNPQHALGSISISLRATSFTGFLKHMTIV